MFAMLALLLACIVFSSLKRAASLVGSGSESRLGAAHAGSRVVS
jgi:hypothetical protein